MLEEFHIPFIYDTFLSIFGLFPWLGCLDENAYSIISITKKYILSFLLGILSYHFVEKPFISSNLSIILRPFKKTFFFLIISLALLLFLNSS
jgi:peptidoglycan/LPS O-acetylase OafA/YrhL